MWGKRSGLGFDRVAYRLLSASVVSAYLLAVAGCGGGSSASGSAGGLNFRAHWQSGGSALSALASTQNGQTGCTGFGSSIPSSVRTVRIAFEANAGLRCCVAVAPGSVPVDGSGQGILTLDALPAGLAALVISGYPTTFAPAPEGFTDQCATNPAVGQPCDTVQVATPNFQSEPHQVSIQPGVVTDAGDICVSALEQPTPTNTPVTPVGSTSTPTPTRTPLPAGTPTTIIVHAGESIAAAAKQAPAGSTIIVSPGLYGPVDLEPGDLQGSLTFFADVQAEFTESVPAPVTVRASGATSALKLSGQADLLIDGFTFRGGSQAVVSLHDSSGITIANSQITGSQGDGLRLDGSSDALIFNDLVFNDGGAGIRCSGSTGVEIINNTIYNNARSGLSVQGGEGIFVENNIFDENSPLGVDVDSAAAGGFEGDYNLNRDGYGASTPSGVHDITGPVGNPLFIAPGLENFHLARGIAGSVSPAIDTGDPDTDSDLAGVLAERTTQTDGTLDTGRVDLGFHYLPPVPTPTPRTTAE